MLDSTLPVQMTFQVKPQILSDQISFNFLCQKTFHDNEYCDLSCNFKSPKQIRFLVKVIRIKSTTIDTTVNVKADHVRQKRENAH